MQQQCSQVLAGIRALSSRAETMKQGQQQGQQGQDQQRADQQRRADQPPSGARQPDTAERSRDSMLKAAKPITQARFSADNLENADVRNMEDEDLGDVSDVVMDKGKLSAIIVARGGFLGMGGTYYRLDAAKGEALSPSRSHHRNCDGPRPGDLGR